MYALVRYTDDDIMKIVPVEDIKKFDKDNINTKKKYLVYYEKDKEYYPATIVVVKDSIEEIEEYKVNKRIQFVRKDMLESASESELEVSAPSQKKKMLLQGKPTNNNGSMESEFLKMYESNMEKSIENANVTKKKDKPATENNEIILVENPEVQIKKHKEENKKGYTNEKKVEKDNADIKRENRKLKDKLEDLRLQNAELSTLNIQLQKVVIDNFESLISSKEVEKVPSVAGVVDNQVHLGRGIFVSKEAFNSVWFVSTSGPQFVKNMAVAVFGTETLINSSVTGKTSNKHKKETTKPPLDGTKLAAIEDIYRYYLEKKASTLEASKEIRSIKTYIANKISDLQRVGRKKHEKNGKPEDGDGEGTEAGGEEVEEAVETPKKNGKEEDDGAGNDN